MTKSLTGALSVLLLLSGLAHAQSAMQVVRVQTDDPAAYVAWAEASAEALLADTSGAVGTCVPVFGAEDQRDVFFFSVAPNMEALLSIDLTSPTVQREVAEVEDIRSVLARDIWVSLKSRPGRGAGSRWAQASLFVETAQPARYVELLAAQESALHQNGFDDVTWSAFAINTGTSAGTVVANLQAPTASRLGAAFDAIQTASWSNFASGEFSGVRTLVQNVVGECALYAVNP